MSNYLTVTFPEDITDSYTLKKGGGTIFASTYLYFKSEIDPLVLTYVSLNNTLQIENIGSAKANTTFIFLTKSLNCIKIRKINNYVKIYMSGMIVAFNNAMCISEYIKLTIPNSNDPTAVYRYVFSLSEYQGTFFINYLFHGTNFTITSMYFTVTKNPYLTAGTIKPTQIIT